MISDAAPELSAPVSLSQEDVRQVAQDVFQAMLGLDVASDESPDAAAPDQLPLNACVQITGAWQGAVVIETTRRLAVRAAQIVFGADADTSTPTDTYDALAELINMVGGNIKTLLPSPSVMSLPSVTDGRQFLVLLPGARIVHQSRLSCQAEAVNIVLWEQAPKKVNRETTTLGHRRNRS